MTDQTDRVLPGSSGDSRRSFLKRGTLAAGALTVGASGTATAQEEDGTFSDLDDGWKALIQVDSFHPNARFMFVSEILEWSPTYGDIQDSWFSDYDTYQIRWLNTDEIVPLYVAHDANIGEYDEELGFIPDADGDQNQPQLFEMNREWTPFSDNNRLLTVNASPVTEEEEDGILEVQDWW